MVAFGDRLTLLKASGWESHYIDYDQLKDMIAKIEASAEAKEFESAAFSAALEKEIKRVDGA